MLRPDARRELCSSFDSEVGVFYNYFRDYDPATGRYVQSDPIGLQGGLQGGLNTYGYVGGNALGAVDPTGEVAQYALLIIGRILSSGGRGAASGAGQGTAGAGAASATANLVGAGGIAAGVAPSPNTVSHSEEARALATNTWDPCDQMKWAILVLRETIKWRKSDLNPAERGQQVYVNHQKRIRILSDHLSSLERAYKERCDPNGC